MVMAPLVLQVFQRQTHCCTEIKMTISYHIRVRDKCIFNDAVTKVTYHGLCKNETEHWSKDTERGKLKYWEPNLLV
jgi:hypothetical protein